MSQERGFRASPRPAGSLRLASRWAKSLERGFRAGPRPAGSLRLASRWANTTTLSARRLRLVLAAIWLLDAALQYQPFMFTKAFGHLLAASAPGNPAFIAGPVTWSAGLIEHYPAASNAAFATIQLLLAIGIAWRPTVKIALAASVAWSIAVWWLGEGLGGVLAGSATPWNGAPGAVIIYALLAVLLWPTGRDPSASFVAGRPFGRRPARLLWLVLWGSLAYFAFKAAGTAAPGSHGMLSSMTAGGTGGAAPAAHGAAALLAQHGPQVSAVLALTCELIAVGVFLPASMARVTVLLAVAAAAAIWVIGENFGALFTGTATDPNTGLLLGLLAAAYWPAGSTATAKAASPPAIGTDPAAAVSLGGTP